MQQIVEYVPWIFLSYGVFRMAFSSGGYYIQNNHASTGTFNIIFALLSLKNDETISYCFFIKFCIIN